MIPPPTKTDEKLKERADALRGTFLHQHMLDALRAEPTWTPVMYCVYNDFSEETTDGLLALWNEPNHGIARGEP